MSRDEIRDGEKQRDQRIFKYFVNFFFYPYNTIVQIAKRNKYVIISNIEKKRERRNFYKNEKH